MTVVLWITSKIRIEISILYWLLFPSYEKSVYGTSTWRVLRWLCLSLHIGTEHMAKKDWSDDEVIRQMKNLEKEVESTKSKSKPSVKRR